MPRLISHRIGWVCLLTVTLANAAPAQTYTWNATSGDWSIGSNWLGGVAPPGAGAGALLFGGDTSYTATDDRTGFPFPFYLNSITTSNSGDIVIADTSPASENGTPMRFVGTSPQITVGGSGSFRLEHAVEVLAGQTLNIAVNSGAGQFSLGDATNTTDGTYSALNGRGTVILNNASSNAVLLSSIGSFQGTLQLQSGSFAFAPTGGDTGNRTVLDISSGVTVQASGGISNFLGGLTGSGTINFGTGTGQVSLYRNEGRIWAGQITGDMNSLAVNNGATWTNNNTYEAGTYINGGVFRLKDGGKISGHQSLTIDESHFILDNTGTSNDNDRVNDDISVNLRGQLTLLGRDNTATTETLDRLFFTVSGFGGDRPATINVVPGVGGTATLTIGQLQPRSQGAFLEFTGAGSVVLTAAPTMTGGIIASTVKNNEWATLNPSNVVVPLSNYQTSTNPTAWGSTDNVKLNSAVISATGTRSVNTLYINAAQTLDIGSGSTLTVTSGIFANASATISNGTLRPGPTTNSEQVIYVTSGNTLTVSAPIANGASTSSLLKAGPGKLILEGSNTFGPSSGNTAGIYIFGGILSVASDANLGAGGNHIIMAGGTLQFTAGGTYARTISFSGTHTDTIDTGANNVVLTNSVGSASTESLINGAGPRKLGSGSLTIQGGGGYPVPLTIIEGKVIATGNYRGPSEGVSFVETGATFDTSSTTFSQAVRIYGIEGGGDLLIRDPVSGAGGVLFGTENTDVTEITFAGRIRSALNGTLTANGASSATVQWGTSSTSSTTQGALTARLSGESDYANKTVIANAKVRVAADVLAGQPGPFGNPAAANRTIQLSPTSGIPSSGALLIAESGVTIGRDIATNSSSAPNAVLQIGSDHTTGSSTYSGNVTLSRWVELTASGTATTTFSGILSGSGGVNKVGTGTIVLSNTNSYTGPTSVNEGTLRVNGSTAAGSVVRVGNRGRLSGSGTILGSLGIEAGGIVAPGNALGTFTVYAATIAGAAHWQFEINDALGTDGSATNSWDKLTSAASILTLTATPAKPIVVDLISLNIDQEPGIAANFNPGQSYSWKFGSFGGGITGFNTNAFEVDTTHFANSPGLEGFSVTKNVNDLYVVYVPVPEPGLLLMIGAFGLGAARRRYLLSRLRAAPSSS